MAIDSKDTPKNDLEIRMRLSLGKLISRGQLSGGINFFTKDNVLPAYLDFFSTGILFENRILDYLGIEFLEVLCQNYRYYFKGSSSRNVTTYSKMCSATNNQVPGMPEVTLTIRDIYKISFTSQNYFIFPTEILQTEQ